MPTVDLSIHGLLEGNFFNFLIIVGLIVYAGVKLNASGALEAAKKSVEKILKESDEHKINSQKTLETAKNKDKDLQLEIEKIKREGQNTIETFKKATQEELAQAVQRLEINAQKALDTEVQKVSSALQKEAAMKSVEVAQNKTRNNLLENSSLHRKFIDEAINKIEELEI